MKLGTVTQFARERLLKNVKNTDEFAQAAKTLINKTKPILIGQKEIEAIKHDPTTLNFFLMKPMLDD